MLIAVCADKGSPGVTTTALVLASAWSSPAMVVELDPAGGDLAIRLRVNGSALPEAPTVLTVAAAARSNRTGDVLERHAHRQSGQVSVVPGAIMQEQMAKVGDWHPLADALAASDDAAFADVGHLHSGSRLLALAARADVVVTVCRPDATSVIRLRERMARLASELGALRGSPPRLFPLLVTLARHGNKDVTDLRGILDETPAKPFLVGSGFIALDPAAVHRLETGEDPTGRLARTDLMRSARHTAEQLGQTVGTADPLAADTSLSGGSP
jgi:hypothetical protein